MVKISQMPPDSTPTNLDSFVTVDNESGTNKKVSLADAIAAIFANSTSLQLLTALAAATPIDQNILINGGMDVWQRNITFTPNDDTFICDRWNCLQEANASWTFARDTDVPSTGGSHNSLKCSNVTLNNQCGIVQILEGQDSVPLLGKSVSLSFMAKTNGTEIANLRCAILSWSSTEDAVTSDVVGTWAQNGTNPTWATNWTMENTPSNLALTSSWQKFTIENVAIDTAGAKNVAAVIWVDDGTITAGDDFYITQVFLNVGAKALPYKGRPFAEELALCQRYYEKSYLYGTYAGAAVGEDYANLQHSIVAAVGGTARNYFVYQVRKRTAATVQTYDGAGTAGKLSYGVDAATFNNNTANFGTPTSGTTGFLTGSSGALGGSNDYIACAWTADAEL